MASVSRSLSARSLVYGVFMEEKAETVTRPCPSSCFPMNQLRPETGPPARTQVAAAPLWWPPPMQAAACVLCGERGRSLACACSWSVSPGLRRRPPIPSERRSASRPEDRPDVGDDCFVVAREIGLITPACAKKACKRQDEVGNDSWLSKKLG